MRKTISRRFNLRNLRLEDIPEQVWVIGILLISAAIGFLTATYEEPLFIMVAAVLPLVVLSFYKTIEKPVFMPVLVMFTALFSPITLPTGTSSVIVDSLLVTSGFIGLWFFSMMLNKDFSSFLLDAPTKWILIFIAVVPISLLWGNLLRDPILSVPNSFIFVQVATTVVMIMLPGAMLLTANHIHSITPMRWIVALLILAGGVGIFTETGYLPSELVYPGGLFTMWVVCFAACLILFDKKYPPFLKVLTGAMALTWMYYRFVINTEWVAGWLPPLFVLSIIFFFRSKKLVILLVLALIAFIVINASYFQNFLTEETNVSGNTRQAAWLLNLSVVGKHFLFGTGPGGYIAYYWVYFPREAVATHNNYLDILSATGIVGFIPFVVFFFLIAIKGYKVYRKFRGRGDFVEAAAIGAFAGTMGCIFAMGLGDWMIPFPYTQGIFAFDFEVLNWIFLGFILALDRMPATVEAV